MRVLIIKLSSLGDIIHTLPALTDAQSAWPAIQFDWVIDPAFQEIPLWHSAVRSVIPAPLRAWRRDYWGSFMRGEPQRFFRQLKETRYDYVIDAQGLMKSAILSFYAKGQRIGFDFRSARERWAACFYQKRIFVEKQQHAIERIRLLFAKGLGYVFPEGAPSYGIQQEKLSPWVQLGSSIKTFKVSDNQLRGGSLQELGKTFGKRPYYLFLHGTTWATKHWYEDYWVKLAQYATQEGKQVYLLWGNEQEAARAHRIAEKVAGVWVLPPLILSAIARLMILSEGVVTLDTGLGHLAAALGVPTLGLYGPNDPGRSGVVGDHAMNLSVSYPCAPCLRRHCLYAKNREAEGPPPCFSTLSPDKVWASFSQLLKN